MVVGKFKTPIDVRLPNLDEELRFEKVVSVRKFNWWKAISVATVAVIGVGLIMSGLSQMLPAQISQVSSNTVALNTEVLQSTTTTFASASNNAFSFLPNIIPFVGILGGVLVASFAMAGIYSNRITLDRFRKDSQGRFLTTSGHIDIKAYAIDALKQLSELGKDPRQRVEDFILTREDIEDLSHIKSAVEFASTAMRSKYLFLGFVYKIKFCPDERTTLYHKDGYTTQTGKLRYQRYIKKAFNAEDIDNLRTVKLNPLGNTKTLEHFMREYLEEAAEFYGQSFDDYYSYINKEGKVTKDLGKAIDILRPVLKWEPQKFYWDFDKMGAGEKRSISLSWQHTDTCLNILPGGVGRLDKMWQNLGNILLYLSMGYSIEVIAEKLMKNQGVTHRGGLPGVKTAVGKFIRENFGGIKNAYAMTVDKVVSNLDGNFEDEVIYEAYKYYFDSRDTEYSDFNKIKFLELAIGGKLENEMISYLHMNINSISKWVTKYIKEDFPYLTGWLSFRKYILAPIFLQLYIDNDISINDIADLYPGMGEDYPSNVMKSIYKMPPPVIRKGCRLSQMNARLSERSFATLVDFKSSLNDIKPWVISEMIKTYVARPINDFSFFEQYKIARLAPKIQRYYKMGLPPSFIIKVMPHFVTEADLLSWTKKVFKLTRPYSSISPEEFFLLNTWDEADFLREWSVRLTPMISFKGKDYYFSNI